VQLHESYAKDGVVCMSVSLDKFKHRTADDARDFLASKNAAFPNYYLEDWKTIGEKWGFGGIPHVRVYDREGKVKGDYSDYKDEVIPAVKELLGNGK
jgi:hypothetical protein